ncbi:MULTISPECIES: 3'-5' exonuclease family protein [Halomonas]|uniref:3'-5' exonuclease n=1 Tax=Halomonas halophila TaxID=29573 RepID=A0ABQ0UB66_9GAMM|nr:MULTISPECIES: DNA polymerase III subunit epsilon [Halomonas]MDR5889906.1 3'-5' exonuclease [Halomonas salina]RAH38803.1 3'-5' exonuclease [Halomonas sp. SL1]WJY06693.1 3'-5' exonuclease [Halomonas halophila]GEK74254.1 3'-5' exonuclease [Halomonas halophila]
MLKTLRRLVDRHRHAHGQYGWLFRPYTGEELVALAVQSTGGDVRSAEPLAIAAVRLRGDRVLTSESLELRLTRPEGVDAEVLRRHGLRGIDLDDGVTLDQALARLLDFVGNRPLVGWRLDRDLALLNRPLRARFGFDLPNAGIDLVQRYQRYHHHSRLEVAPAFERVAAQLEVPLMGRHSVLGTAVTTALMHLRLDRDALLERRSG